MKRYVIERDLPGIGSMMSGAAHGAARCRAGWAKAHIPDLSYFD